MSDRSLVPFKKLKIEGTQMRAAIDQEYVADIAAVIKDGGHLPDAVCFYDGADYWLADGFHRFHGHKSAGKDAMLCEVRHGTQRDAILFAAGCNSEHGMRRTNADKRKAVSALLDDEEWGKASDRWIAEQCRVHHDLVGSVRKEREQPNTTSTGGSASSNNNGSQNSQTGAGKRTGKDGKRRGPKEAPLCDNCKHRKEIGRTPVADCENCKKVRKAKKEKKPRKKPEPPTVVKDQTGEQVPDRLRDVFADPSLSNLVGELESIEAMFSPKSVVERAGKLTAHYPFILIAKVDECLHESLHQLQIALQSLKAGLPHAVCPKCKAELNCKPCRTCRGSGHIPEHRFQELLAEKS